MKARQQDGAATPRIRVITVTRIGRSPLRLNDEERRDTVVKEFFLDYSSCQSEMDWAPAVEGGRHRRAAELGELISESQYRSIAARFFVRGCHLTEADIRHGSWRK